LQHKVPFSQFLEFQKPQEANLSNTYAHLTNYAINKQHHSFSIDEDENSNKGHKRLLTNLFQNERYTDLMKQISQIVVKTVIAGLPPLVSAYEQCKIIDPNSCFQLLGFDVMLTDKSEVLLLEVNQNPSLATDTSFDYKLKS
jgi:hypothetical protein